MACSDPKPTRRRRWTALFASAGLSALMAGAVAAQPAEPQATEVSEVVVTASRTIQTIPMAISAIDAESLERTGQGGLEDYTRTVPGVSLQSSGPGRNKIDIRGVTAGGFDFTDAQDRALVSVYLDDVPISLAASTPELKVFDLERVEVIRGPQGTLYGAGSMAGTIRLITQKPDLGGYFGDAQTAASVTEEAGDLNYNVRGMANLPLVADRLGLRVTAYAGRNAGFVDNLGRGEDDVNDEATYQVRAAVRAEVNDRFTVDASAIYAELDADGLPTGYLGLGDYATSIIGPEGFKDRLRIYNVTGTLDLGWSELTASTSRVSRNNYNAIGGNQYLLALFLFQEVIEANIFVTNDIGEWDNEIRLTSKHDGPFSWTIGAFHQDQERVVWHFDPSDDFDDRLSALFGLPPGSYSSEADGSFGPDADFSGLQKIDERQLAVFGEASFAPTDKLTLTAGLRYFDWPQDFDLFFGGFFGISAPGVPLTIVDSASETGVNPRFAVKYQIDDDRTVFAEAARGFRYGGVNQPLPLALCAADLAEAGLTEGPVTFGADSLWSYSVGEKGRFLDDRLTLNATAFLVDWSDVQTKRNLPNCFYYFIQNKGSVESKGIEIESSVRVTEDLTLGINAAFTDAGANGDITNLGAVDGDRVPYFPQYIVSLNGEYVRMMGEGELIVQGDWTFRDNSFTRFDRQDPRTREIPSSDSLNLAVNYRIGRYEFGVFGQNLTNGVEILQRGPDSYAPFQPGDTVTWARPRTIGARLKASF